MLAAACAPRARVTEYAKASPSAASNASVAPSQVIKPWSQIAEQRPSPPNLPSLDQAETALSRKPRDPQANLTYAFVLYQSQAFEMAAAAFDKTAALMPDNPTPRLYQGYALMAWGVVTQARDAFQKVTTLKGADRHSVSEAYLQIGTLEYLFLKDNTAAKAAFAKSLASNPKQAMASMGAGTIAAENKQWDEARAGFTEAAKNAQKPKEKAKAYACLGLLHQQTGDWKQAAAYYEKSLATDPDNRMVKQGLAALKTAPEKPLPPKS